MSAAVRNLIAPSDPTLLTTMVECGEKCLPRPWSRRKKLERTFDVFADCVIEAKA
jgi:hypothetical protein